MAKAAKPKPAKPEEHITPVPTQMQQHPAIVRLREKIRKDKQGEAKERRKP
jgi:hypothetical protein